MASIYLAGPDVFFPDTIRNRIEATKKAILAEHGLEALSPCDNDLDLDNASNPAQLIYNANRDLMNQAEGLIANLTPFRGPSADAGTIFELGFMTAQGKPVAAYTTCATPYNQRVSGGAETDANGTLVEGFGLCDNLMLDCGIEASGGAFISGSLEWRSEGFTPEESFDEELFRKAVEVLSRHF
ncbi:MAG: nucleoside 2-deoxyribosyltransferase [Pseudomonadota bacterium]